MATFESAADAIARPAVGFTRLQVVAARLWAPFVIMGFIIVVASFVIGIINSQITADYFAFPKIEREAAEAGSSLVDKKVFIEATGSWLPQFMFLGLGLVLSGIAFLLATILGTLRVAGATVQQSLGTTIVIPRPPFISKVFPISMMAGLIVLIAGMILGIVQAVIAAGYWNHSISNELNPAPAGSTLLSDLGTIEAIDRWLTPLSFLGITLLLVGIVLALATVIWILRFQSGRLLEIMAGRP